MKSKLFCPIIKKPCVKQDCFFELVGRRQASCLLVLAVSKYVGLGINQELKELAEGV